jgi:UDP:flavonoid glycosyltransferase YjiC (YdhE family)
MRITVAAAGTRGDVQPIIALCKRLQAQGHMMTVVAASNFAAWIGSHGLGFVPTVDIDALMNSEMGLAWTEGSSNPMHQINMMRDSDERALIL